MTPGALLRWKRGRPSFIRHALDVARGNQRYDLPFREIVRAVDVEIQPVARGPRVTVARLELDCGHLVPLPGGALVDRMQPGQLRQCRPCADGEPHRQ
jgi:hypothetical protein